MALWPSSIVRLIQKCSRLQGRGKQFMSLHWLCILWVTTFLTCETEPQRGRKQSVWSPEDAGTVWYYLCTGCIGASVWSLSTGAQSFRLQHQMFLSWLVKEWPVLLTSRQLWPRLSDRPAFNGRLVRSPISVDYLCKIKNPKLPQIGIRVIFRC